jgi:hypothetical protein
VVSFDAFSAQVRCIWVSENGLLLAYCIEFDCFVRPLSVHDGPVMRLTSNTDKISSVWGSKDCRLLVTGHYVAGEAILWCLITGRALKKIDALQGCKAVSGFGRVSDAHCPLTLVFGCDKSSDGVSVWRVNLDSDDHVQPAGRTHLSAQDSCKDVLSGLSSDASKRNAHMEAQARIKPGELSVEHLYSFPTIHDVHCVLSSADGSTLFFAGRERNISIYRLDRLSTSGPSLKMFQRSRDARQMLRQHHHAVGLLLNDGSLMEWLLQDELDDALAELLLHRPGAALLPLTDGVTSTFQLAIKMRRSEVLHRLLSAAVRFTTEGEPEVHVAGAWAHGLGNRSPRANADNPSQELEDLRLPCPALIRVTDCLVYALKSANMSQVCFCVCMCARACMYVCMNACMYVWMYVCMYVCMDPCMYACMWA